MGSSKIKLLLDVIGQQGEDLRQIFREMAGDAFITRGHCSRQTASEVRSDHRFTHIRHDMLPCLFELVRPSLELSKKTQMNWTLLNLPALPRAKI